MTENVNEIVVDARNLEPPEPMDRALAAAARVKDGQVVRMLLHREPFPLYAMLEDMGFAHRTRLTPTGDFEILFARPVDFAQAVAER